MSAIIQIRPQNGETADLALVQVREAQKMESIGRLVGGVAHDFNNLLTGIVLACDLLLAGMDRKSRLRRYAEEIRMGAVQGAGLIQQLVEVARQRVVEPRLLSFNDAITNLRSLLARLIGENIELVTHLAGNLRLVKMDPALVQQIILNLVLNARDAMPDGGRITLSTRNYESASNPVEFAPGIEFVAADSGCGMDAETRARAFEPFFTTKPSGQGNGLGLATVHSIVKQAGGIIEVESAPGQGTRITVRLPQGEVESGTIEVCEVANLAAATSAGQSAKEKG
jgi:signal transduction histidine kinase